MPKNKRKWLALIHQIPPKPDAFRVKIWRRLQQIGAMAIKQSVYVLPASEQSREDLGWTLKLILEGGGHGSISEIRFLEGITDEQIIAQFQEARKSDYKKIVQEASQLLSEWSSGNMDPKDPSTKATAHLNKLRRQFDSIAAIDFFEPPEKNTAQLLIQDLSALASGGASVPNREGLGSLEGKTWVTRRSLFVDRIACGWLIRRFIDADASFQYVESDAYVPGPGEVRFDMFEGEFTHEGDLCTFEVMIKRLDLHDHALTALGEVIHDIDLKEDKYHHAETKGFNAMLTGLTASEPEDDKRMELGAQFMDNLYAYFQRRMPNS